MGENPYETWRWAGSLAIKHALNVLYLFYIYLLILFPCLYFFPICLILSSALSSQERIFTLEVYQRQESGTVEIALFTDLYFMTRLQNSYYCVMCFSRSCYSCFLTCASFYAFSPKKENLVWGHLYRPMAVIYCRIKIC